MTDAPGVRKGEAGDVCADGDVAASDANDAAEVAELVVASTECAGADVGCEPDEGDQLADDARKLHSRPAIKWSPSLPLCPWAAWGQEVQFAARWQPGRPS